jgi:hypothetical protein
MLLLLAGRFRSATRKGRRRCRVSTRNRRSAGCRRGAGEGGTDHGLPAKAKISAELRASWDERVAALGFEAGKDAFEVLNMAGPGRRDW